MAAMEKQTTNSPPPNNHHDDFDNNNNNNNHLLLSTPSSQFEIEVEFVSDDEMSLIEAAFAATRSPSSLLHQNNVRSITSIATLAAKRRLSGGCSTESLSACTPEIEDSGGRAKRNKSQRQSLLHRFRKARGFGLSVTDITSADWCEKQRELYLTSGKPPVTSKAMEAGSARHAVLEKEVTKKVKVRVVSAEDTWAVKMINCIHGANQLLLDGLTRELPLIGFEDGVCIVGVIDEIRMQTTEAGCTPTLVETKTRSHNSLPPEPQRRNGRLQLMCYKFFWDKLVADKFPSRQFLEMFSLNPYHILSEEIRENTAKSGFASETLDDILRCYGNTCSMLQRSDEQLLLRYESQEDHSLIAEDYFFYDPDWVSVKIKDSLDFWRGEREARYAPEDERWKCKRCDASGCPINTKLVPDDTQAAEI